MVEKINIAHIIRFPDNNNKNLLLFGNKNVGIKKELQIIKI